MAESSTENFKYTNDQTNELLLATVTNFQLMFFQNLSLQNTLKTHFSQDLRVFLVQISINNIEKICYDEPLRRGVIILEELEMTIKVALDMVSNEEIDNINN